MKKLILGALLLFGGATSANAYCVYYMTVNVAFYGGPEVHFWRECSYGSGWMNPVQLW